MSACNFEYLVKLIDKQLDLDKQIEVYDHVKQCAICRDAIHQLSRDLHGAFSVCSAHSATSCTIRRQIDSAGSGRVRTSASAPLHAALS
jgi:hypothetical protein